ncbi:MAG TPA: carbon-nitrogen hydrolase family protein [Peptococcaceae bacterium]|jgi:predicted amidohydrolase|nr:carbon-nitrogen hydrolase family protein [Clostridia bacterium]HOB81606.1 carbon-nitrogen hydrolase family protein [Peptococcaceae bacterium]HQD53918.1 carbon-nitrogen hydrolase family protein [Peptococcaceae bacterium]
MSIKVAVIQQWANNVQDAEKALALSLEMIDQAKMERPDLVVLPECVYPGYFLDQAAVHGLPEHLREGLAKALSAFCARARQNRFYLIVGVPEIEGDSLYDSAYLIDRQGQILGTARKSFLWHYDRQWFSPGAAYPVFSTELGKIGMIVCADGRQPEISRILTLNGAQIIVDVTNWVSSGPNPHQLSNPQYEYILPSRAVENKVWYIAANKVGVEAESIVYCGRSCIISPNGYELAVAPSHQEDILSATLDVTLSDDKRLNEDFHLLKGRRPELYHPLCAGEEPPVAEVLREKVVPAALSLYAGAVQLKEDLTVTALLTKLQELIPRAALQGLRLLVFPELACLFEEGATKKILSVAREYAAQYELMLVLGTVLSKGTQKVKAAALILPSGEVHYAEKCHLAQHEAHRFAAGTEQPVVQTPYGRLGIMMGYEGLLPEVARCLMLKGADLLCWVTSFSSDYHRLFARTRAVENRVFLIAGNVWGEKGCGLSSIAAPGGNLVASAFGQGDQIISAQLDLALARNKTIVPGTDIVANRLPHAYGRLLEK